MCKERQGHNNDHWHECMTAGPRKELRRKHTEYIRTATELRLILALTQEERGSYREVKPL